MRACAQAREEREVQVGRKGKEKGGSSFAVQES